MATLVTTEEPRRLGSWAKLPRNVCAQEYEKTLYPDQETEILLMYFHAWKRDFEKELLVRGKKVRLEVNQFFVSIPELIKRLPLLRLTKDKALGLLKKLKRDGWIDYSNLHGRGYIVSFVAYTNVSKAADRKSDTESDTESYQENLFRKGFEDGDPTQNPTQNPTHPKKSRHRNPKESIVTSAPSDTLRKVLKKDLKNVIPSSSPTELIGAGAESKESPPTTTPRETKNRSNTLEERVSSVIKDVFWGNNTLRKRTKTLRETTIDHIAKEVVEQGGKSIVEALEEFVISRDIRRQDFSPKALEELIGAACGGDLAIEINLQPRSFP